MHTDVGGALPVARPPSVLHAGTHLPRPAVITVASCSGPRAYVGVVSLFQELQAEGFTRLTDQDWSQDIYAVEHTPAWLEPALAR